jgi:hypothetical protein
MIGVLPVFEARSFWFDGEVPDHEEKPPVRELERGGFAVSVVAPYTEIQRVIALDIPTLELCLSLVAARIAKQIPVTKAYGYSDDIYLWLPDNSDKLAYQGWIWGAAYMSSD